MRPIPIKDQHVRLAPPPDWDPDVHGECVILDAIKCDDEVFYSFWRLEPEELAALNRGAPLRLGVFSKAHPAVCVGVIDDQDPDYPSLLAGFDEEKGKHMTEETTTVDLDHPNVSAAVSAFLNDMAKWTHIENRQAGWWNDPVTKEHLLSNPTYAPYVVATKLFLQISEVIEAGEGYRRGQNDDKLPHRSAIEVELVDVLIRVFDLAGALNLDLGGAWKEKREFNAGRADHKIENRVKTGGKKF